SYVVPAKTTTIDTTSGEKSGRTITLTAEDMQRKKNYVKARTTLLLSLPDEHQVRFSKYKTTRELWAAILKTIIGNEATKKTKKNLLKQQYGNFKEEGSENLEQTFNRLQVIIGQLQCIDVEIEQDDLNQKFLTSLALEWLMHIIVWRNMSDLDTMSLDYLYNHLKVYESETDMVIHTAKTKMMRLVVESECVGKIADAFDKGTGSSNGLQLVQVDLNYVHALNEPHLHEIRIVPSKHEADQHFSGADPLPI
nr:hypothetical protein [Tanacetum cinerariifolium]